MEVDYKKLFKNCLCVIEEKDGYVVPVRLSKKQLAAFNKVSSKNIINGNFTSGTCIEFFSSSFSFSFDVITGNYNQFYANFDIFLNGNYVNSVIFNNEHEKKFHFVFSTEVENKKKFTVYFPHGTDARIKNFEIKDIEYIETKKKLLLSFGDSITQGYVSKFPRFTYPVMLSMKLNMDLLNQGMDGYTFESETIDENLKINPSIITVAFGTNDWELCDSMDFIKNKINLFFNKLSRVYPNVLVFVITPIWRQDYKVVRKSGTLANVTSAIVDSANKYNNFNIIDGMKLVPHDKNLFGPDVLHPTEEGFKIYTENLFNQIKQFV
ncbi:MAG: SGNH/GDSL hydrolase family protein [Sphaerochaetaceae bacterium]